MTVAAPVSAGSSLSLLWSARDACRVRLGALCLLLASIGELLGLAFRGPMASPGGAPAWFAAVSASPTLHLGWGLLLPSSMLQCFGWLALYRWRRDTPDESVAFWGMILLIGSIVAFLPVAGALGFVSQEAAAAQAAGQSGAVALVAATAEGPFARIFLLVSVLAGLIGVILWARVLWRASGLAHWVVFFLIFHTVTQSITSPMFPPWGYRLERLGAVGMLLVSASIAARIWRDTATVRQAQSVAP
ncbi:MAG TPA: hypothetical protein VGD63_07685 [Steroidobacteraceae bacterium]